MNCAKDLLLSPAKLFNNSQALAKAIKDGKAFHLFSTVDGSYTGVSFYFQHSADNAVSGRDMRCVVKFLTNIPIMHGGKS